MAQLVYPQSIDAGTPAVASEVQGNFVAARDVVNGQLEGFKGVYPNILPGSLGAQDLNGTPAYYLHGTDGVRQPGVVSGLKVTPGAGLVLNFSSGFMWALDGGAVGHTNTGGADPLIPGFINSGTVTIAANSSGNPRIDQVVGTLTNYGIGTVSVLQGTPTAAADLTNRNGAVGALPPGSIRLADILMPNGFAGPFVQNTHIRDRRAWVYGAYYRVTSTVGDQAFTSASMTDLLVGTIDARLELSGGPVEVNLAAAAFHTTGGSTSDVQLVDNGNVIGIINQLFPGTGQRRPFYRWAWTPAAGSHYLKFQVATSAATATIRATTANPLVVTMQEFLRPSSQNSGA